MELAGEGLIGYDSISVPGSRVPSLPLPIFVLTILLRRLPYKEQPHGSCACCTGIKGASSLLLCLPDQRHHRLQAAAPPAHVARAPGVVPDLLHCDRHASAHPHRRLRMLTRARMSSSVLSVI